MYRAQAPIHNRTNVTAEPVNLWRVLFFPLRFYHYRNLSFAVIIINFFFLCIFNVNVVVIRWSECILVNIIMLQKNTGEKILKKKKRYALKQCGHVRHHVPISWSLRARDDVLAASDALLLLLYYYYYIPAKFAYNNFFFLFSTIFVTSRIV